MARKIMKYGKWYLAYELASSLVFIGVSTVGYRLAGL